MVDFTGIDDGWLNRSSVIMLATKHVILSEVDIERTEGAINVRCAVLYMQRCVQ